MIHPNIIISVCQSPPSKLQAAVGAFLEGEGRRSTWVISPPSVKLSSKFLLILGSTLYRIGINVSNYY